MLDFIVFFLMFFITIDSSCILLLKKVTDVSDYSKKNKMNGRKMASNGLNRVLDGQKQMQRVMRNF
jgi:hypothetical protein